jgi:hypothetical protein
MRHFRVKASNNSKTTAFCGGNFGQKNGHS